VDGEVYGVPEFFNSIVLVINQQALEEAGLTVDDVDTSDWEALRELNQQLTINDGNLTRIVSRRKLPEFLPLWVRAKGGQVLSADGCRSMLDSPEVVEAVEFA